MRFSQKNIMKDCSSSMIENEPLISIWKVKPTILDTASVSVSQQLVHVVLKTLGYSHNKVRVHARLSSTEIAATAFLKRRDRYDAEKRRLFFSVYETCFRGYGRNVHGYLQRGSPLCLRPNSKRYRLSSSILAAVDPFGGLSFACKEVS